MRIVRLQQGTLEWHRWRFEGLGGSDVAAILGVSPYEDATADNVFQEKLSYRDREPTFAMRRGQRYEPIAREMFADRHGWHFTPACVEHDDERWMRASLDGIGEDFVGGPQLLEIKAPDWKTHDEVLAGFVPEHFMVQIQWQLLVTGADVCHLVSFNDGSRFGVRSQLAHVVVEPDAEKQAEILEAAEPFWKRVLEARRQPALV